MRRVRIHKEGKPSGRRIEDVLAPDEPDQTRSHRQGRQLLRQLEDMRDELDELLAQRGVGRTIDK